MIRLRFVAEYGLLSWLICFWTHSTVSHVGALFDDPDYGRVEIGARLFRDKAFDRRGGLRARPANYARFRRVLTVGIPCDDIRAARFRKLLRSQIGDSYDWRAIMSFVIGRSKFRKHAFDCSSWMAWALINAGVIHPVKLAKRKWSPNDVLVACCAAYPVTIEEQKG